MKYHKNKIQATFKLSTTYNCILHIDSLIPTSFDWICKVITEDWSKCMKSHDYIKCLLKILKIQIGITLHNIIPARSC